MDRLETERLLLRPWRPEEAGVQRELWTERDPRVPARRRIDADGRPSIQDLEAAIRHEATRHEATRHEATRRADRRRAAAPGIGLLALERRRTGEVIGYCGLVEDGPGAAALGDGHPGPELAVELLRRAQGQGYAAEAARAVIAWAREAGIETLQATVWDWNSPSRRLLDRLGFVERDRTRPPGTPHAMLVMTLAL